MRIFISYKANCSQGEPTEAAIFAEKLFPILKTEYDDVFLDKQSIEPPGDWRKILEEKIHKADVFIVLFAKESPEDKKSYFPAELRSIQSSFEDGKKNGINKKIIPVLFDDIKIDDLPGFFKNYQVVSDKNHEIKNQQIKQSLDKIKQETKKNTLFVKERRIITLPILLVLLLIVVVVVVLVNISNSSTSPETQLSCKPFEGNYSLYQKYIFKDNPRYRIVVNKKNSKWSNVSCEERNNEIFLRGDDETTFGIESVVDGKFEVLAHVLYSYTSEVTLDKRTRAGKRYFGKSEQTYINEDNKPKNKGFSENERLDFMDRNHSGEFFSKDTKSDREAIVESAIKELNRNFADKVPHECHVAIGKIGSNMFAFVCPEYTRVMEKK